MLKSMRIGLTFKTISTVARNKALLNSGATKNFLDLQAWKELRIGRFQLETPVPVRNVDGTSNSAGSIKYFCWLKVRIAKRERRMKFFLTNLGNDRFILGYPFLKEFNPKIDWEKAQLLDRKFEIKTMGFRQAQEKVQRFQNAAIQKCGKPMEGLALYLRKTTISQKMAQEGRKAKEPDKIELPKEYQKHWRVFSESRAQRFPPEREENMVIKLLPNAPTSINCKVYPLNRKETDILRKFLAEEEEKGYIKQGSSPYTALVFFVGKKDSEELRPVMDYHELNKWTERDNNPLPNIRTALENLQEGELYSKFDLRWGYKNLRIKEEDQTKATFKTTFGTYIPQVTYFGLTNTPPTFQRVIHQDLQPILQKYPQEVGNYLDDIWIVTKKDEKGRAQHKKITHKLLELLEEKSYFLKLSKSQFETEDMDLLGWRVKNGEIRIDPDKIAGLKDWPCKLKNIKQVCSVLGILGYQRPFIQGFAKLARPLTELTKKDKNFEWTQECRTALDALINIVMSEPVLKCPNPEKPFKLEVDASAFAIGAILFQQDENGKQREIGYYLKALNEMERNYNIWDREFMSVIFGLRNWRHLLVGSPHQVTVYMDHANLQYYQHLQKINRWVARYISTLADYNLELKHLPGIKNHADPLSRRPDHNDGSNDNEQVMVLPDELFTKVIETTALD